MNKKNDIINSNPIKILKKNNSFRSQNKKKDSFKVNRAIKTNLNNKTSFPKDGDNNIFTKSRIKKNNSKKSEIKNSVLATFNKKLKLNKLKVKRKNSKNILFNINEEQKEIDRNEIIKRIQNKELNHEINRKVDLSNSKINKINTKQTEIEKTLNDIKNLNKEQQNKFCFYHIFSSNHLFFYNLIQNMMK